MTARKSRCWAEIDCAALRHNAAVARELAGPGGALLAIVKADGYGHGMIPVARELAAGGDVAFFGVANVSEAARLQDALPGFNITLLSPALADEREEIVARGLRPWISSVDEARAYAQAAGAVGRPAPFEVEVKVDTGMGRMGVLEDGLAELLAAIAQMPALRLTGVVTHLPSADEDEAFTRAQLQAFGHLTETVPTARRHAQNSAGLIGYARGDCNIVRPGLMLYGSSPIPGFQARLRPVLTLKTHVTLVRDLPAGRGVSYGRTFITPGPMRVGTLAVGYADGYPRRLSNTGAEVLVRGRRCPVLGRITMDQTMIDLSALPGVEPGETATLIGESIPAAELAARAGTIPWEIFTGLTARVTRCYNNESPATRLD